MSETSGIRAVVYPPVNHHGYCNFCDRQITAHGGVPHAVLEMSGAGLLARICRPCAETLLPTLTLFAKGRK